MKKDFFRFKQFTVRQNSAAMKVGVDSVLLGAWTCVDHSLLDARHSSPITCHPPFRILDVGAGTGLLALMTAQRYPDAAIDSVEIDRDAYRQAAENVSDSQWNNRIRVIFDDFINYALHCSLCYDLIISNPPYFTTSLKPPDTKRNITRYNDSLPHRFLLNGSVKLLTPFGVLAIVLPPVEALTVIDEAMAYGLFVKRTLYVQSLPSKPVYRMLVELSKSEYPRNDQTLCIEKADRSDYTDEYKQLTKAFYLKF